MRSSWEPTQGFFPHLVLLSGLAISLTQFSDELGPSVATVIKISNFLKFLLPPTPVHSATPGPSARVSGFSTINATVHAISISLSFMLAAGICSMPALP